MSKIVPAPILDVDPEARVMHWFDPGPGEPFDADLVWPWPAVTVLSDEECDDIYAGDWT